jgi:hypothetical protein
VNTKLLECFRTITATKQDRRPRKVPIIGKIKMLQKNLNATLQLSMPFRKKLPGRPAFLGMEGLSRCSYATSFFNLTSFWFGCILDAQETAPSAAAGCTVTINGYATKKPQYYNPKFHVYSDRSTSADSFGIL